MPTTRTKTRRTKTPASARQTPDWMAMLMSHNPEFTLTVKTEGRILKELPLSRAVIQQFAIETQALRGLGPIVRQKYGDTPARQAAA